MQSGKPIKLSLSALAREFTCTRETMRKKLAAAGVSTVDIAGPPAAQMTTDGAAEALSADTGLYLLSDVIRAWLPAAEAENPAGLDPVRRRAHYQAELDRLKLEQETRELIPRSEVEQEQARILQQVALTLDTLPDIIERDCGASADQVKRIERAVDEVREQLFGDLVTGARQE